MVVTTFVPSTLRKMLLVSSSFTLATACTSKRMASAILQASATGNLANNVRDLKTAHLLSQLLLLVVVVVDGLQQQGHAGWQSGQWT